MKKQKTIGIIGGLGHEASANIYLKMIHYCQKKYKAINDDDFPRILIEGGACPGFDENGIQIPILAKSYIVKLAKKLEAQGADCLVIPCNSIHTFADEIKEAISIPFINIITKAKEKVVKYPFKKVGLICSASTNKDKIYQKNFKDTNLEIIAPNPEQQKILTDVIYAVMGGTQGSYETIQIKRVIQEMAWKGAEAIILGCTELPLAINQLHTDEKLFDTIDILIQAAVDFVIQK